MKRIISQLKRTNFVSINNAFRGTHPGRQVTLADVQTIQKACNIPIVAYTLDFIEKQRLPRTQLLKNFIGFAIASPMREINFPRFYVCIPASRRRLPAKYSSIMEKAFKTVNEAISKGVASVHMARGYHRQYPYRVSINVKSFPEPAKEPSVIGLEQAVRTVNSVLIADVFEGSLRKKGILVTKSTGAMKWIVYPAEFTTGMPPGRDSFALLVMPQKTESLAPERMVYIPKEQLPRSTISKIKAAFDTINKAIAEDKVTQGGVGRQNLLPFNISIKGELFGGPNKIDSKEYKNLIDAVKIVNGILATLHAPYAMMTQKP